MQVKFFLYVAIANIIISTVVSILLTWHGVKDEDITQEIAALFVILLGYKGAYQSYLLHKSQQR